MASTYLTRTPSSASNRRVFTFSAWVKRCNESGANVIFQQGSDTANRFSLNFQGGNLRWRGLTGGSNTAYLQTNRVFRDPSAWYHIVARFDSTNATAGDRMRLYVNGVEETDFSTDINPSLNYESFVNTTNPIDIGRDNASNASFFDGEMAHVHFIDGTAYDASTFGETDATTGIWKPKTAPSVTYGTNGFFLKFENSGAFGTDSSGNANNFTVNGTMTQTIDTPSNVFATLNPLKFTGGTLSNGNLQLDSSSNSWKTRYSTLGVSAGKYYMEFKMGSVTDDQSAVSIVSDNTLDGNVPGVDANASPAITYLSNGTKLVNGTASSSYFSAMSSNDIIGIALDMDGGTVQFYKNGSTTGSAINLSDAFTSSNYPLFFCGGVFNTRNIQANFGNGYFGTTAVSSAENPDDGIGIFEYAVPTGYKALCTKSINAQEYD
jgi:hypothetical protein